MKRLKILLYLPIAVIRLVFIFFFSIFMLYRVKFLIRFKEKPQQYTFLILQQWAKVLLIVLGFRVKWEKNNEFPDHSILMSNHRSYIDPLIIFSVYPAVIIAKKEMLAWPVIGTGLKLLNCILVDRQNVRSLIETMKKTEIAVHEIGRLVLFPEGTTCVGPKTNPLKAGTFKVAAKNHFPIIPVAIEYEDQEIAWIGSHVFILHFITKMGKPINRAKVCIGDPIILSDEKEILKTTKHWMDEKLVKMRNEWDLKR